jgi:chromosome segregation ATPase
MHGHFTRRQVRLLNANARALQAESYALYEATKDERVLLRQLEAQRDKLERELRDISGPHVGYDHPGQKEKVIQRLQQQIADLREREEETRVELARLGASSAETARYAGQARQAFDRVAKLLEPEFREELRVEDDINPPRRLPQAGRLT